MAQVFIPPKEIFLLDLPAGKKIVDSAGGGKLNLPGPEPDSGTCGELLILVDRKRSVMNELRVDIGPLSISFEL
ncbi:MAG: hypothetical protein ACLQBK_20110 [Candidatus Sulfotelmatobacter sp.]